MPGDFGLWSLESLLAGDAELLCFNLSSMADIGFSSFKYIDFSSFISLWPIS